LHPFLGVVTAGVYRLRKLLTAERPTSPECPRFGKHSIGPAFCLPWNLVAERKALGVAVLVSGGETHLPLNLFLLLLGLGFETRLHDSESLK
jgi:hypothetical protein